VQGCQIFLGTVYVPIREKYTKSVQNGHKNTKWPQKYQMATKIPNGREVDQTALKYTNIFHCKTLQNLPKLIFLA
jgi:hypothetical protein